MLDTAAAAGSGISRLVLDLGGAGRPTQVGSTSAWPGRHGRSRAAADAPIQAVTELTDSRPRLDGRRSDRALTLADEVRSGSWTRVEAVAAVSRTSGSWSGGRGPSPDQRRPRP